MVVTRNEAKIDFACITTEESPTVVYCTGPQIPLGTTVLIEVFAAEERVLLASGEFTLMAFALPTVQAGGVGLPTPGALFLARHPHAAPLWDTDSGHGISERHFEIPYKHSVDFPAIAASLD